MYDDIEPLLSDAGLPLGQPFTAAQSRARGITPDVLRRMCREGLVRRVFRGVYVDAAADDTLASRAQALALVVPPTAIVTDECAAWALGVDLLARGDHLIPPPLSIHQPLERTRVRQPRTAGGRRTLTARDIELVNGIRVTSGLRTACDLARLRAQPRGLAALDALQRRQRFSAEQLAAEIPRFAGHRGVVRLRELAPLADPHAESPAESSMRLLWLDAGLPSVTTQIPVLDDWGNEIYRLDMGIPEIRYAAEYDGVAWHSSPEQKNHDRRRRTWLREHRGWDIDVLGSEEVFLRPQRAPEIFRSGIARAEWRRAHAA
ncbi:hypothetical protein BH18ACT9_BH18ACT9_20630 [soil metagenome]